MNCAICLTLCALWVLLSLLVHDPAHCHCWRTPQHSVFFLFQSSETFQGSSSALPAENTPGLSINEQNLNVKRADFYSCVSIHLRTIIIVYLHKSILYVQSAKTDLKLQNLRVNSCNDISEHKRNLQKV